MEGSFGAKAPCSRDYDAACDFCSSGPVGLLGEAAFTKPAASVASSGSGTNRGPPQHSERDSDLGEVTFATTCNTGSSPRTQKPLLKLRASALLCGFQWRPRCKVTGPARVALSLSSPTRPPCPPRRCRVLSHPVTKPASNIPKLSNSSQST